MGDGYIRTCLRKIFWPYQTGSKNQVLSVNFIIISPQKTLEGFLGSMIFGSFAFYSLVTALDWTALNQRGLLFVSVIFVLLCVIGDLFESWIKRLCSAKDSGSVFPGHGGMMDRTDSFIFSVPFIFIYINCIKRV